jgi:hypothetical protein
VKSSVSADNYRSIFFTAVHSVIIQMMVVPIRAMFISIIILHIDFGIIYDFSIPGIGTIEELGSWRSWRI